MHALQPLDVSIFKSLKDNYSKTMCSLTFVYKNIVVSKREFARISKRPFERSFPFQISRAGFAKTGIYSFKPDAISNK